MEPLTLLALVAAAGFIFDKISPKKNTRDDPKLPPLTYSKDVVSPKAASRKSVSLKETDLDILPEYILAKKLIQQRFPLVFVTGGAGTGKSTFIHWLLKEFDGRALLAAPTAMAAVNIGGKTLHSLCQLPPAWIIRKDIKLTPRRREIAEAEVLIIDEISMVTANLLDGVSAFFRKNRRVDKPFGGIPVVMVGDMFQLPPVVAGNTKELFERIYGSPKFYNAKCLNNTSFYAIELHKTFRQVDQHFVDMLSRIREGVEVQQALTTLNAACKITESPPIGSVWLSPRNAEVDTINQTELRKIKSPIKVYRGSISGNFKSDRLPSPIDMVLKKGAQVMFTKNDRQKRWINGSVGIVTNLDNDKIFVEMAETKTCVEVERVTWSDYQYHWNERTSEIERTVIGEYIQFPLVLAWAITIHKSQGRTIENVHIDLGAGAFETGQTYVALSRCRSIDGLTLSRPLNLGDIMVDEESKLFYDRLRSVIKNLPPDKMMKSLEENLMEGDQIEDDIPF